VHDCTCAELTEISFYDIVVTSHICRGEPKSLGLFLNIFCVKEKRINTEQNIRKILINLYLHINILMHIFSLLCEVPCDLSLDEFVISHGSIVFKEILTKES